MLRSLADKSEGEAWFTVMAPSKAERAAWLRALVNAKVHQMVCSPEECKRRIFLDTTRAGYEDDLCRAVDLYFRKYQQ